MLELSAKQCLVVEVVRRYDLGSDENFLAIIEHESGYIVWDNQKGDFVRIESWGSVRNFLLQEEAEDHARHLAGPAPLDCVIIPVIEMTEEQSRRRLAGLMPEEELVQLERESRIKAVGDYVGRRLRGLRFV